MAGSTADQAPAEGESERLGEEERAQAADHAAPHAKVIHEVIRHEGEIELARSVGALVWSGLAAGLSMGFSLICLSFLHVGLPEAPWRHIVESPGYSVGFVITILGRQQLFTESTLTGLLPFLVARDRPTLVALARTWSVVLVANLAGTALIAGAISVPGLFPDDIHRAMIEIGQTAMAGSFWQKAGRAVFAGWLIALMVWLLPSAKSARLFVILLLTDDRCALQLPAYHRRIGRNRAARVYPGGQRAGLSFPLPGSGAARQHGGRRRARGPPELRAPWRPKSRAIRNRMPTRLRAMQRRPRKVRARHVRVDKTTAGAGRPF